MCVYGPIRCMFAWMHLYYCRGGCCLFVNPSACDCIYGYKPLLLLFGFGAFAVVEWLRVATIDSCCRCYYCHQHYRSDYQRCQQHWTILTAHRLTASSITVATTATATRTRELVAAVCNWLFRQPMSPVTRPLSPC